MLGGEHYSLSVTEGDYRLMGWMHLRKDFDSDTNISEDRAKEIAFRFLEKHAPDLLDTVEVRWIQATIKVPVNPPHDEGFILQDGTIITGMRVKLWDNLSKKYAWVIVGANEQIISFERDVVWNTQKHCRTTERWLHDDWLQL